MEGADVMTLAQLVDLASAADGLPETRPEWLRTFIEGVPGNERYYRFLYELARRARPAAMVETGTRLGCSAAQMALGNPEGKMITVDIDPAAKARADALGLTNLTAVLSDSRVAFSAVRAAVPAIDLLYIDSDHTFDLASAEYWLYRTIVREEGVILFDDIHINADMERFWAMVPEPKAEANFLHRHYGFGISIKCSGDRP